jgi:hypothetical protein
MIITPENAKAHEPSLIEDIAPPHAEKYTDADRDEVRRRSIGSLNKQYERSKQKFKELKRNKSTQNRFEPQIVEPTRQSARLKYSAVPPLQTLSSLPEPAKNAEIHEENWFNRQYKLAAESLSMAWLTVAGWFHGVALKMFPKRYTAESGLVVDWQAPSVSRMKFALPLLAVALLVLTVWAARPNLPGIPGFNKQNSATSSGSADSTTSSTQSSSGTSKPGNKPVPPSAVSPVAPVNTPTAAGVSGAASPQSITPQPLTPLVGGMGSGSGYNVQVPTPTPTPAPANSIPPTNTVTVPSTQVQVGDKTLLQTNSTNLTVN